MKQCKTCKEYKEVTEFYKQGVRNGKPRNGYQFECKVCTRLRTKKNSTKEYRRYNMVKFKYGLSKDEYNQLLKLYPVCAICGQDFYKNEPTVDHCHKTGKVRALLCYHCNAGIGRFNDDPDLIQKAINYLLKFKESFPADCPSDKEGFSSN